MLLQLGIKQTCDKFVSVNGMSVVPGKFLRRVQALCVSRLIQSVRSNAAITYASTICDAIKQNESELKKENWTYGSRDIAILVINRIELQVNSLEITNVKKFRGKSAIFRDTQKNDLDLMNWYISLPCKMGCYVSSVIVQDLCSIERHSNSNAAIFFPNRELPIYPQLVNSVLPYRTNIRCLRTKINSHRPYC